MAPVLKTGIPERVSGVRIPPSPPFDFAAPSALGIYPLNFFFFVFPRIFIHKDLRARSMVDPGKILSRKDLQVKYSRTRT